MIGRGRRGSPPPRPAGDVMGSDIGRHGPRGGASAPPRGAVSLRRQADAPRCRGTPSVEFTWVARSRKRPTVVHADCKNVTSLPLPMDDIPPVLLLLPTRREIDRGLRNAKILTAVEGQSSCQQPGASHAPGEDKTCGEDNDTASHPPPPGSIWVHWVSFFTVSAAVESPTARERGKKIAEERAGIVSLRLHRRLHTARH